MSALFGDDMIERPIPELPEGAHFVPGWLTLEQQRWAVDRFHEWARGPVPIRAAKVHGHEMSVRTVCLGWHWRPYEYTREAVDVNRDRVLDFPDWMVPGPKGTGRGDRQPARRRRLHAGHRAGELLR